MKALVGYLNDKGIDAAITEETAPVSIPADRTDPVAKLKGHVFDSIRLLATPYNSCGEMANIYRFQFGIRTESSLSREQMKGIAARMKPVIERNIFGMPHGDVTEVVWYGQELAEILNHDEELSGTIRQASKKIDSLELEVKANDPSTIEIMGPWFSEAPQFLDKPEDGYKVSEEEKIFTFETYQKIAGHISDVIKASRVSEKV